MGRSPATNSPDDSVVLINGPWTHRMVRANGIALHVAEMGTGPLVLMLHGFPQFWWTWHQQMVDLADAGFRAVSVDLRGYGASDKPPRGYDAPNLTADIANLVRALGERDAIIVGNDIGGALAWTVAAMHPRVVRRLAVVGAAHPLRLRSAILADPRGQ
ncbi:MAG TPA: alpha/beta fold hydrolase, partial [Jatrophihabitantaceae bacterium]|nr:alpha/beta fold hydrolase [Jatrophihabitantaceae bacterium]